MSGGKKSRGCQKIEIKKISNKSKMQVTFSKRRNGLFNKAWELFTLYGAYVALIIFSPTGKVFSFGLPDLDTVIDRYLSRAPRLDNDTRQFIEAFRSTNLRELNDALDHEKRCRDDLIRIDEMNMDQLKFLKKSFEELKKIVDQSTDRLE